jgi:hypothetical protein
MNKTPTMFSASRTGRARQNISLSTGDLAMTNILNLPEADMLLNEILKAAKFNREIPLDNLGKIAQQSLDEYNQNTPVNIRTSP